jgi:hypothetical protein
MPKLIVMDSISFLASSRFSACRTLLLVSRKLLCKIYHEFQWTKMAILHPPYFFCKIFMDFFIEVMLSRTEFIFSPLIIVMLQCRLKISVFQVAQLASLLFVQFELRAKSTNFLSIYEYNVVS